MYQQVNNQKETYLSTFLKAILQKLLKVIKRIRYFDPNLSNNVEKWDSKAYFPILRAWRPFTRSRGEPGREGHGLVAGRRCKHDLEGAFSKATIFRFLVKSTTPLDGGGHL